MKRYQPQGLTQNKVKGDTDPFSWIFKYEKNITKTHKQTKKRSLFSDLGAVYGAPLALQNVIVITANPFFPPPLFFAATFRQNKRASRGGRCRHQSRENSIALASLPVNNGIWWLQETNSRHLSTLMMATLVITRGMHDVRCYPLLALLLNNRWGHVVLDLVWWWNKD